MNTCPRDRALLLLAAGEGASQEQAHLQSCQRCTRRYQRLTQRLANIEHTLRETEPPALLTPSLTPLRYWVPRAAALAAVLLFVWGGVWLSMTEHRSTETTSAKKSFARNWEQSWTSPFFTTEDGLMIAPPAPVSGAVYLQAALAEGGWPCEWQETFATPTCAIHPFPLALAMQSLEEVMYE